jgi:hypothetical protein
MKQKSRMSIKLASMAHRNISGFIIYNHTRSRKLQQNVGARVTETMVPKRHGAAAAVRA